jgi:hypothetical protein
MFILISVTLQELQIRVTDSPEVHRSGWEEGFFLREVFASNLYQQPDLYPSKYRRLQLLH